MEDGNVKIIEELRQRIADLEAGHTANAQRIQHNRQGVRCALAVLVFMAVVFGAPIAAVRWEGKEFSIERDTGNPVLIFVGGLLGASLFIDGNAKELLDKFLKQKN